MLEAIFVRSHAATSTIPARVSASTASVRITLAYDHTLSEEQNCTQAARACAVRMGWHSATFVGGVLPSGDCAYVSTDKHNLNTEARFDV